MTINRGAERFGAVGALLALLVVALAACTNAPTGGVTTPTATATPSGTTSASATATSAPPNVTGGYAVKVYYARHPDTDNDPTKVFAVARTSPTLGVATYAIGQLLAGPSAAEQGAGYYTPWVGAFTGASNCSGADFTVTLDHRGPTAAPGVATLKLCRTTQIAGELAGVRMSATAQATLLQFVNIHSVVILNAAGACFDDLSGLNRCLNS